MSARVMRAAAVVIVAAAVAIATPAAPVSAAPGGLEYSADGTTWTSTAPASVFPAAYALVPGDAVSATIWVRSARPGLARLTAVLADVTTSSPEAGVVFELEGADTTGRGLPRTAADRIRDCTELVPSRVLAAGAVARITTTVSMPATVSGLDGQGASLAFDLQLGLADLQLPTTPSGCPFDATVIPSLPNSGGTGGTIAQTGVDLLPQTLAIAGAATAAGFALLLLARRRRRTRTDHPQSVDDTVGRPL